MTSKPTWIKWLAQLGLIARYVDIDPATVAGKPDLWVLPDGTLKYFDGTVTKILSEFISLTDHAAIDHTGLKGVGGGAAGGDAVRLTLPLNRFRIGTGFTVITGATTPSIEEDSDRTRILLPGGDASTLFVEGALPFPRMEPALPFVVSLKLRMAKGSDSDVVTIDASTDLNLALSGGGALTGSPSGTVLEAESTITPITKTSPGSGDLVDAFDFLAELKFSAHATDDLYIYAAWLEYILNSPNA